MDMNVTVGSGEGFGQQLDHLYTFLVDDLSDKRTIDLPFLHSPLWPLSVLTIYFALVFYWIPK